MQKKISRIAVSIATLALVAAPLVSLAAVPDPNANLNAPAPSANLNLGLNYATAIGLGTRDVRDVISGIIKAFLGILGILAVLLVLYGGFKWMTAGGNDEKVGEAKKLIASGIIGLVIILSAYAITNFVLSQLINITNAGR